MTTAPSAAEVIKALRLATSSEKAQILEAMQGATGAGGEAVRVASDLEYIRRVLEVLSEQDAVLMLSDTARSVWGVSEREVIDRLEPFLDAHWEALSDDLGKVALVCRTVGKRVLRQAERRVQLARRNRGAQSIAAVLTLMEIAAERAKAAGVDEEQLLEEVSRTYGELVVEYGQQLGLDPKADAIHGWAVGDLLLLNRCKAWIRDNRKAVYWGDWMQLNHALYGLFMSCKRTGLEPGINERQVRRQRAQNPHILYAGLRKGEPAKWGGYLADVDGRADQGQRVWGGVKDVSEMGKSLQRWLDEKAKEKGIEHGERGGGFRLIP